MSAGKSRRMLSDEASGQLELLLTSFVVGARLALALPSYDCGSIKRPNGSHRLASRPTPRLDELAPTTLTWVKGGALEPRPRS